MTADLASSYYEWLYSHVADLSDPRPDMSHRIITSILHSKTFHWTVPNDDNRASDGLALRDEYCDYIGTWGDEPFQYKPATIFEVLVALARRAAYEGEGLTNIEGLDSWFWLFMANLGLAKITDQAYMHSEVQSQYEIICNLDTFLDRKYGDDGRGGLFPLRKPIIPQWRAELWFQMQAYLLENSQLEF